MNLDLLQKEIYKLISLDNEVYLNYLPLKDINDKELDYLNNVYITYSLNDIENLATYKDSILLEIEVISDIDNVTDVQSKAIEIDLTLINNDWIESCNSKIIRSNVYFMPLNDLEEKKFQVTLNYRILKY